MAKLIKLVLKDIGRSFDGEYELDPSLGWTNRELNIVKRISGVRAGEIEEAAEAGDNDLVVALAVIAVRQSGKDWQTFEKLIWDTKGTIEIPDDEEDEAEEDSDDAVPLNLPTSPEKPETRSEPTPSTGPPSSDDGDDLPEKSLPPIGVLPSADVA